jgi:putative ABC transport system permease protein
MGNFTKDLHYAWRMLVKNPGFTLVAVLALGLGIGANSAIFSVFNGMLWRPLSAKHPEQLVRVAIKAPDVFVPMPLSYPDFQDYAKLNSVFAGLAGYMQLPVNVGAQGRPERAWAEVVTGNYFRVLGIDPIQGRTFAPDEGWAPNKDPLLIISYKYWQKRFGGDPNIVGEAVEVNRHSFTIIGVLPATYRGAYYFLDPDVYAPLSMIGLLSSEQSDVLTNRSSVSLRVLGRLEPGVSSEQAMAAAQTVDQRLAEDYPDSHKGSSLLVIPELKARPEPGINGYMSTVMKAFMFLVGLVLLIACANVANLILARANGRRKEITTRTALGATRARLIAQMLTESVILGALGGAAGLVFARWAAFGLMSIRIPSDVPLRLFDLSMDWRIFGFSLVIALLTGIAAGAIPAWQNSRADLATALKAGGRSSGNSTNHHRFRNALVVSQVAVSLLLLVCAGFFLRSLSNSASVDMGFRVDHTLVASVDLGLQGYSEERGQRFYKQINNRLRGMPGVRDAAVAAYIPMGSGNSLVDVFVEGRVLQKDAKSPSSLQNMVQPSYFRTVGNAVIAGREFTDSDDAKAPKVAIINEEFAHKIWPGQNALGKVFRIQRSGDPIQVVGVMRTGKYLFLYEPPQMMVFFPLAQRYSPNATLFLRSESDPGQLVSGLRDEVAQLDSNLPVYGLTTMAEHLKYGTALLPARLAAVLVGAFGLLGLVLASIGVYGVVSYSVGQRTQEIGIRTALGASRSHVLNAVLRQSMTMAGIGVAIGIALAFLVFHALKSVLYGVRSTDWVTLSSVTLLIVFVAFAAAYLPALRATRVDVLAALRNE